MNKLKKLISLSLISLILITTINYALTSNPFQEEEQAMCEQINGQTMCLTQNYENKVQIQYTDDIYCSANSSVLTVNSTHLCGSSIKIISPKTFQLEYRRLTTLKEKQEGLGITTTETRTRTYYPDEEINALINVELVKNCKITYEDKTINYYEFTCKAKGIKKTAQIMPMAGENVIILNYENSYIQSIIAFIINNIIYITLLLIIIAIILSTIFKKNNIKPRKKKKRIKMRKK